VRGATGGDAISVWGKDSCAPLALTPHSDFLDIRLRGVEYDKEINILY